MISDEEKKLEPLTEFETKYLSNVEMLCSFKKTASQLPNLRYFYYAEGEDRFFENPSLPNTFVRFRRSGHPDKNGVYYQQLTSKTKLPDATNNLQRKEPNLMVPGSVEEVLGFIDSIGFVYTHTIWKGCHIYVYDECTISFYSVLFEDNFEHFAEIEIDESTVHNYTKTEALAIIEKYEDLLSEIDGVSAKKRLKLSLRERYRKKDR